MKGQAICKRFLEHVLEAPDNLWWKRGKSMMKKGLAILLAAALLLAMLPYGQRGLPIAAAAPDETEGEKLHYYIIPRNFTSFGSWSLTGEHVTGRATASAPGGGIDEGEPAVAKVSIQSAGEYRVWVRDRDYATNQPGTRTFQASVNGERISHTFGAHGQEGFRWSDGGTFTLHAGVNELALHDTSGFYARNEGFFLTKELSLIPPENLDELRALAEPENPFSFLPDANFPAWAVADDMVAAETASIENEKFRIVFYRGEGEQGSLVQNEIYINDSGQWVRVKARTEELGFLMMAAAGSELVGQSGEFLQFKQELNVDGSKVNMVVDDFFRTGVPVWFVPSSFEQVNEKRIDLGFGNSEAELTVRFEFDDVTLDPKVTLDAEFEEAGAYSFMLYNGNETPYEDYDTVTAPMLYVKKTVPAAPTVIPEAYMFTPMATLHYAAGNDRFQGAEMTAGIVMDPASVPQDFAYPDTSSFGLVLRGPEGDVRPQLTAPMFGTEHSRFDAGERYTVSYRILYEQGSWYNTFRHVSEDLFKVRDLRTNYFHSLNEAIYNATDLMMDDDFGGWDAVNMAHYNMEEQDMTTLSNAMSALQRYLLTEDESLLEQRAVPTLAFMLSRQKQHFKITDSKGGASYSSVLPTPLGGPVQLFSAHVYGGLYEMTQGRMPFLLDYALDAASTQSNLTGIADQASLYKYTGDQTHLDNLVELADRYLTSHPNAGANREARFMGSFIYSDYILPLTAFMAAYEATGEQRYLDAAEETGRLLLTSLWTTGYHDDYAETDYTVTQEKTGPRLLNAEKYTFWWHGDKQWRLGNEDGGAKPAQELNLPLPAETAPGWLGGRVGMGTEHTVTPGHGNIITMNNWAGMLSRLSVYTDDPYFYTMARNAMIGRFGNYPGYYQDRIIFHQMKEDYPYTGPDYTSIYWHHIPVFISMLEDFLINSVWVKSEQNISFPSLYQSGYAYFASNQFGHAPGAFYDEDGMWLWLDRDIIEPDSKEINYIAARKDGVLGLALMNEGNDPLQTTIRLGAKTNPNYTGIATVYDADGNTSTVQIESGEFTVDIPAKGIKSVMIRNLAEVRTPAFANPDFEYSDYTEGNTVEHGRGKGHVIQVAPDHYYAYVYVSDLNSATEKVTLHYMIGDETFTQEKSGYPYEFLIKVDDPDETFRYELVADRVGGSTELLSGGELKPYDFTHPGLSVEPKQLGPVLELDSKALRSGMSPTSGTLRFVVPAEDFFPILPAVDTLKGMKISGTLTHKTDGSVKRLISEVVASEVNTGADTGTLTVVVKPTISVPLAAYSDHDVRLTVTVPADQVLAFNPLPVAVTQVGMAASRNEIRLVVSQSDFPQPLKENQLSGLRISGTLTSKTDQSVLQLASVIRGNEIRANGTTVLVVEPTPEVPLREYRDYDFDIAVDYPAFWEPLPIDEPIDLTVAQAGTSPSQKMLRLVVQTSDLPFTPVNGDLKGLRVAGEIRNLSTGDILSLNSFIMNTEVVANNRTVLVIPPTSTVSLREYKVSDYETTLTVYPQIAGAWNMKAERSGEWQYELNSEGNAVTLVGYNGLGSPVIPERIAGLPVTAIGMSAFRNKDIRSVSIPDSVVEIGHSAFRGNDLTVVTVPDGVDRIGDSAFRHNKLQTLVAAGAATVFDGTPLALNTAGLTIYGFADSTAEQHAAQQQYSFVAIEPIELDMQPDGMEGWTRSVQVEAAASNGDIAIEGIWSQESETPGDDADWTAPTPGAGFELAGADGIWYLHVRAEDAAGLRYHKVSQPFRLDNTPPDIELQMNGIESSSPSVTVGISILDDGAGVDPASLLYAWTASATEPGNDAEWKSFEPDDEVVLNLGWGDWYLHVRAADHAGNEAALHSNTFRLLNPNAAGPTPWVPPANDDHPLEEQEESGEQGEPEKDGTSEEVRPTPVFHDISGHWSEQVMNELAAKGIILGYPDGSLQPDRTMTRAEFIALLARAFHAQAESAGKPDFEDMAEHWAQAEVAAAQRLGWISGTGNGRFSPDEWITREQMTVILMRIVQPPMLNGGGETFGDMDKIAPWARESVSAAAGIGIIAGYPDGNFRPAQAATRAEAAAVLARILLLDGIGEGE
ncbi:hypothetical protein B1748_03970 [Paenibacillus sp. MY03]|nr:hypothetical protein B1748_03970 [Paenibacillus sp. MY03]